MDSKKWTDAQRKASRAALEIFDELQETASATTIERMYALKTAVNRARDVGVNRAVGVHPKHFTIEDSNILNDLYNGIAYSLIILESYGEHFGSGGNATRVEMEGFPHGLMSAQFLTYHLALRDYLAFIKEDFGEIQEFRTDPRITRQQLEDVQMMKRHAKEWADAHANSPDES